MRETYEYARLHLIVTGGLRTPDGSGALPDHLISVLFTQDGATFEALPADETGIFRIANTLGQEGWIIPEVRLAVADQSAVPVAVRAQIANRFGGMWGLITRYSQHWITRRITWPDDADETM